ncbi:MAG: hypothetical protein FJW30_20390 [Acidobacteria bacterium]|nr:hypothetical protein [Acidobacteriota bacterium]
MVHSFLSTIGKAIKSVNPGDVRVMAERTVHVGLMASTEDRLNQMWFWLAPVGISDAKRQQLAALVHPMGPRVPEMPPVPAHLDLELWEEGLPKPPHAFYFYRDDPARTVAEILAGREELGLPLSRRFLAFRPAVSEKIVSSICNENVVFAVTTSLPNLIPSFISLPWVVGEFASDTAFLTMNQLRMAFLLAGAHDRPIGYREQKAQVAGVIAGAFGWRAIAREVISKIPFGGGVVGKAAVSYAGTWVVGRSLEKLYRSGANLSSGEQKSAYSDGLERGRNVAQKLLEAFRSAKKG